MKKIRLILAGLCSVAAGCGSSGGGGNIAATGAANVAIGKAITNAFTGASGQAQMRSALREAGAPESLSGALSEAALSAVTGSCGQGCTSTSGQAQFNCSFPAAAQSCTGGGSVSGNFTVALTENCATQVVTGDLELDATFNNCSDQGVTLNNTSGPLKVNVHLASQTSATVTMQVSGLQIIGSFCSQNINQTCDINVTGTVTTTGTQTTTTLSGQVCGCDANKLSQSQNICTASC